MSEVDDKSLYFQILEKMKEESLVSLRQSTIFDKFEVGREELVS